MDYLLPDDILEGILQFCPDFATLRSAALVSKPFYEAYSQHPNTITRRVAWNVAGPALPSALRLLRHPDCRIKPERDLDSDDEDDSTSSPPAIDIFASVETADGPPLTVAEQDKLTEYAETVNKLEDIFSWRFKDRSSKTSLLNSFESWRFRRALFRLWLYSRIFNLMRYSPDIVDGLEDEELAEMSRKDISSKKSFILDFLPEELVEFYAVGSFLQDLAEWSSQASGAFAHYASFRGIALAVGPSYILKAYETASEYPISTQVEEDLCCDVYEIPAEFVDEYIDRPLNDIWERRKVKPPQRPNGLDNRLWYVIVDDVQEHDICIKCQHANGLEVWNASNWEYLQGQFSAHNIGHLLAGNAGQVDRFTSRVRRECEALGERFLPQLLDELFAIKSSEYDCWQTTHDLLCINCVREFITKHLHIWLLAKMHASGEPVQDNCWYGYNCRTQVHNSTHSLKLNHLCPQSRF